MNENQLFIGDKIKQFVKKFYVNKLYKGAILFAIITLLTFIVYSVLEYFSYFSSTVRSILFFSYIILFLTTFVFYVVIPLFKIAGFGKQISKEQIADIIGKYFPEIDDKLLNIFQLGDLLKEEDYKSRDLVLAAIDTKIEKIKPFPFIQAIPVKNTTKYLKWLAVPLFLFIVIFSIKSEVFTDSTRRIVNYNQFYEKPAPYSFQIENKDLTTFQNEEFLLKVKVVGKEVPKELYIQVGKKSYKLKKTDAVSFSYVFTNLQKNTDFQITTDEVISKIYTLKVLPKPQTISYTMFLTYPAYLNKNSEIIDNNGDATVPEGTKITWTFYTKNTEKLAFIYHDKRNEMNSLNDIYTKSLVAKSPFDYAIINSNTFFTSRDTLKHTISVIPDQYPEIYVESQRDSLFSDRFYFKGNIKDDYGFRNLQFVYSKYDDKGNLLESNQRITIEINPLNTIQDFYYFFDAGTLKLDAGYKVDYHFEVRDNDGVNGSKMSKTSPFTFRVKTMEEIDKEINSQNKETKSDLQDLMKESAQLVKDIEKLNKQLMQNNTPSWQDKKKLEQLMEQYSELKNKIEELKNKQTEQKMLEEQFKNMTPEILEKQKDLQQRFENILSDELKEMFKKLEDLMSQMNKDQMKDAMEKMKISSEDINKSLDQQLQLFKQLEFEKKYTDIIDKARQLSAEQKLLSEQTPQKDIGKEELLQKQQEIQKKFDQLSKDIKDLEALNKDLEDPNKMMNTEDLQKEINKKMQESKDALDKNNKNKAAGKQQEASEKMEELSDKMEQDMLANEEEDLAEDIESLRQILDNLVQISFKQEDNMTSLRKMNAKSLQITDIMKEQFNIQNNMAMIDDSLSALARRQPAVKPYIQKEVNKIRDYLAKTKNNLNDRQLSQALGNQQFALTSINNLSLMLAESMKEMKQKQSQCKKGKSQGNGSCNNPGGSGKSKMKSARELQQQLNRQMEAMKRSMEQGKKPGEKPGDQPGGQGGTQPSMSEQLAKMAAQQEAIRKMLQEYQNALKSENGVGDKSLDQMIKDMEKTEKDLVNKIINQQTIDRQKNIETRLLESERADMKREKEEKRESIEGKDIRNPNPPKEWKMDKDTEKQNEMLKTVPPNLNYYYKEKVNQYFYNIE